MSALIEAKGLTRVLPETVPVTLVKDVSLAIGERELVAVTGPSGSGKSSLLYLLGLLDRAGRWLGVLLLAPIPLSNIPPALAVALLAIAYLEEDGILLCVALAASVLLLAIAAGAVWQAMGELGWVRGLI